MSDTKATTTSHGPFPESFSVGPPQGENHTITFPDASGYLLSPKDYEDLQAMLKEWRERRAREAWDITG